MSRNDSFAGETMCGTELQNEGKLLKETYTGQIDKTLERQQMLDLQMPSFIRGDENEDSADLF